MATDRTSGSGSTTTSEVSAAAAAERGVGDADAAAAAIVSKFEWPLQQIHFQIYRRHTRSLHCFHKADEYL